MWTGSATGRHVVKFSASGQELARTAVGRVDTPTAVANHDVMRLAVAGTRHVWAVRTAVGELIKLSLAGEVLATYPLGGILYDVVADADGNALLANYTDNTVFAVAPDGTPLGHAAVPGWPFALVLDARGKLWVTSKQADKLTRFAVTAAP